MGKWDINTSLIEISAQTTEKYDNYKQNNRQQPRW